MCVIDSPDLCGFRGCEVGVQPCPSTLCSEPSHQPFRHFFFLMWALRIKLRSLCQALKSETSPHLPSPFLLLLETKDSLVGDTDSRMPGCPPHLPPGHVCFSCIMYNRSVLTSTTMKMRLESHSLPTTAKDHWTYYKKRL